MESIKQGRVKYSKPTSLLGMIAGIGFVIFGVTFFGSEVFSSSNTPPFVILFFILWIGMAVGITFLHGANVFSKKGISLVDVDLRSEGKQENQKSEDFEMKLRKLNALKKDSLINEEEFKKKREKIMQQNW